MIISTYKTVYKGTGNMAKGSVGRPGKYHFGTKDKRGRITTACGLGFNKVLSEKLVAEVGEWDMCAKCMTGVRVVDPSEMKWIPAEEINRVLAELDDNPGYNPTDEELQEFLSQREVDLDKEYGMELEWEFGKERVDE